MATENAYNVMSKRSGIKVGDRVKVLRRFSSYEMGCHAIHDISKDNAVGKVFTVTRVHRDGDIRLDTSGCYDYFPFFVLEIIESVKTIEVRYFCDGKDITGSISEETRRNLHK